MTTDVKGSDTDSGNPWLMVLRVFCSQNVSVGSSFGFFSVMVLPLQKKFDASLTEVTMGLPLVILFMGMLAPFVARLIVRFGFRPIMMTGTISSALGYLALAFAPSLQVALLAFAALVGTGVAFAGSMTSSTFVSQWMGAKRPQQAGRALGLANAPVLLALAPMIGYAIIENFGLKALYLTLVGLNLLVLPLLMGVVQPPARNVAALSTETLSIEPPDIGQSKRRDPPIFMLSYFWMVIFCGGVLAAIGVVGVAHIVVIGEEKGFPMALSTLMASMMGGASVLGAVMVGYLCDRLGGARTLAIAAFGYASCWAWLHFVGSFWVAIPAVLVIGACGAGVYPSAVVALSHYLGAEKLPRALGFYTMFCLPFTFLLPPAAAALHDFAGGYGMMIIGIILISVAVVAVALTLAPRERRAVRDAALKAPARATDMAG